ncbi:MAG TPA: sigma-54 dependent transcriptional regulator [Burkholderiales bacterium]|nr:sigma-54 dependent transcriptional regulator [Burkholderiales bacterium]
MNRVLIVDDEADIRELLLLTLHRMGHEADAAGSCAEALKLLSEHSYQLCLTDMRLPDGDGLQVLNHISENFSQVPVAVITAFGSTENAVAALKAGAFDYLPKPISLKQLRDLIRAALKLPQSAAQRKAQPEPETAAPTPELLGSSPAIARAREMIEKLARSQAPVYITGESGSGKEVAARSIHKRSARREAPFVGVNCGAIPENLMESEFFGYRKGAFTGADADKQGFFQAAHGGTLFLDEVADLPLPMQVKLLRVIQEKRVRKVGDTNEDAVDVRIISATHQNLAELVEAGRFRQDLYYRLNVIELKMPALRQIPEDIPLIARAILTRLAKDTGQPPPEFTSEVLVALKQYEFPGNVRELENVLERAMALSSGNRIEKQDLYLTEVADFEPTESGVARPPGAGELPLQDYLDRVEKEAIMQALEKTRYNKTAAAKLLGITFRALRYRLERLGID